MQMSYADCSEADLEWSFIADQIKETVSTSNVLERLDQKENNEGTPTDPSEEDVEEDGRMSKEDYSSTTSSFLCRSNAEGYYIVELKKLTQECAKGIHPYGFCTTFSSQNNSVSSNVIHTDRFLLEAYVCRNEPSSEKPFMPTSPTLLATSDRKQIFNHSLSFDERKSTSAEHGTTSKRVYETLGEALCLSQRRATKAEKAALQALYDREKIINILFREAWVSHTYKQWVKTLEFENTWLKMCSQSVATRWMQKKSLNPCDEQLMSSSKKVRNEESWKPNQQRTGSDQNSFLGMTIGIAFAFGLSFASAGLMIGWSMGRILLA